MARTHEGAQEQETDEIAEAISRLVEALRDFLVLLVRQSRSGGLR
jgi:hypothetical protein